uniref:Uncharacterized protein n=1 Tax=Arundo donax TaxID=35708 RepID=A0A0A9DJQ6_ARUDO
MQTPLDQTGAPTNRPAPRKKQQRAGNQKRDEEGPTQGGGI